MTPQEQNIAAAEWMGWFKAPKHWLHNGKTYPKIDTWISPGYKDFNHMPAGQMLGAGVPNFHSDLNAIHEAENYFFSTNENSTMIQKWYDTFIEVVCKGSTSIALRANAPMRLEALLRTIGKWKD